MQKENIFRILTPLAKLFVKLGVNFNEVAITLKEAFVIEASKIEGNNKVKIYARTGIDRRTVRHMLNHDQIYCPPDRINLIAKELKQTSGDGKRNIPIRGDKSLESIIQTYAHGRYTTSTVINELERTKRIEASGDFIKFITENIDGGISNEKLAQLLGDSINFINETALYSQNINKHKLFYYWDYSEQIAPENIDKASDAIYAQCQQHRQENLTLLESFETTRFEDQPKIGVLQTQFNFNYYK